MDWEKYLHEYYQAWSSQNADAVMEFFTEESTFEDLAFAVKFAGLEQIRSFVDLTYAGSPDFHIQPTQIIVDKDKAAATWTMSGTHSGDFPGLPATGKHFQVRAVSIVKFEGQKIKEMTDYWNLLDFQRSVGLIES